MSPTHADFSLCKLYGRPDKLCGFKYDYGVSSKLTCYEQGLDITITALHSGRLLIKILTSHSEGIDKL